MSIFNDIYEKQIGFGKAQLLALVSFGFVYMQDGIAQVQSSLIMPVIEKQWSLNDIQIGEFFSLNMIVATASGIISGISLDYFGRKKLLLIGVIGVFLFSMLTIFSDSFWQFTVIRSLGTLFFAMNQLALMSLTQEITLKNDRGKTSAVLTNMNIIGQLITIAVAFFIFPNLHQGNWKELLLFSGLIPGIIAIIMCIFFTFESPRYLLLSNKIPEAFEILNNLIKHNEKNKAEELSESQKEQLLVYAEMENEYVKNVRGSVGELFNSKYRWITLAMLILKLQNLFFFLANTVFLPIIMNKLGSELAQINFITIFVITFTQIPGTYITQMIIDSSRKVTIVFAIICELIAAVICIFSSEYVFIFILIGTKIFDQIMNVTFQVILTEIYPTYLRGTGQGFNASFSRMIGCFFPYLINISFSQFGAKGPIIFGGVFAILGLLVTMSSMFHETANIMLDGDQSIKKNSRRQNRALSASIEARYTDAISLANLENFHYDFDFDNDK